MSRGMNWKRAADQAEFGRYITTKRVPMTKPRRNPVIGRTLRMELLRRFLLRKLEAKVVSQ